jgi:Protein of unknown function (DUF998)
MLKPQSLLNIAVSACFVGPAIMIAADFLTVVLNHRWDLVEQTISGFATGPYGWLEKIGIATIGLCFLLIGLVLLNVNGQKDVRLLKSAGILFGVAAVGFFFTSLLNTNIISFVAGFHVSFHKVALVVASVGFYQACLIFAGLMITKPGLRFWGIYSGFVYLVGLAAFFWVVFSFHYIAYSGLAERILTGLNLIWIIAVGPKVILLSRQLTREKLETGPLQSEPELNQFQIDAQSKVSPLAVPGEPEDKEQTLVTLDTNRR